MMVTENVPNHIACVMDGNGRWAQEKGLKRTDGHAAGEKALLKVVRHASDLGVKWLTVYAFSTENWRRPPAEVKWLFNFNEDMLVERRDELHNNNVKIRFIGRQDKRVPKKLTTRVKESVQLTENNTGLNFTVAFNYGSQAEIVDAVKQIVEAGIDITNIDEKTISSYMYCPEMPPVDLWIRSSGEYRLSNFMLWQSAYSEMYFTDTYWPDMDGSHLEAAIIEYGIRNRRFGGLK